VSGEGAALGGAVRAHFGAAPPEVLGVAVSGGSDSLALLHILDDWREEGGPALRVATVDHGLRPEAGAEAAQVARICAGLGIGHDSLRWDGQGATCPMRRGARATGC
jgi:tRNA(Ile)-lysidine synthase